jgi:predicted ferric reductase
MQKLTVFDTTHDLAIASTNGEREYEVKYDIPGKGEYTEAIVQRVKNGISANYTEAYMRRRDPGTMSIADDKPHR